MRHDVTRVHAAHFTPDMNAAVNGEYHIVARSATPQNAHSVMNAAISGEYCVMLVVADVSLHRPAMNAALSGE